MLQILKKAYDGCSNFFFFLLMCFSFTKLSLLMNSYYSLILSLRSIIWETTPFSPSHVLPIIIIYTDGKVPDKLSLSRQCDDCHAMAGLLKMWIRDLPEPLHTYALYDAFVKVCGMCSPPPTPPHNPPPLSPLASPTISHQFNHVLPPIHPSLLINLHSC